MSRHEMAIGILHVPKCAGTALRDVLRTRPDCYVGPLYYDRSHFGEDDMALRIPEPHRSAIATAADLHHEARGHRVVMGHYSLSSFLQAGCRRHALVVREPRARILSLYRYWRSLDPVERSSWGPWGTEVVRLAEQPLARFLASPMALRAVDNAMARQVLAPTRPGEPLSGWRTARAYRSVRRTLALVQWSDRLDDFLEGLHGELDLVSSAVPRTNLALPPDDEQVLDRPVVRHITALTNRDRQLLDWLMRDGILRHRSNSDMDAEFARTAERLGFRLDAAIGQ